MSFFQELMDDAQKFENDMLGPSYEYTKYIKTPSEMGMSDKGDLKTMAKDISGLISYVELLVQGTGNASKTGQPLGNKFFLQTGAKCISPDKKEHDRFIYINNVPSGNIPFISTGIGVNFTEFRGLVPGALQDLNVLSPYGIMQSFLSGSTPPCQQITMETIGIDNKHSMETQYVTENDIKRMDACDFVIPPMNGKPAHVNPLNPTSICRQAFQNRIDTGNTDIKDNTEYNYKVVTSVDPDFPSNPLIQLYFICLGILGIVILYKIAYKRS